MISLQHGDLVRAESSQLDCRVESLAGEGGQGEVYRAELAGRIVALKWYYRQAATAAQRSALEVLVRKGPPDDRFLWPLELASRSQSYGFGYIMPFRDARFRAVSDLMKRRIEPTFRALTTAGFQLADSFFQLHSKGLCYRDISFGNLFLDPEDGDILICDNDNVTVDGGPGSGILGTPRFMAPEVVRGAALPSTQTDLYSLSVLLFYLFMVHHPLEGRRELEIHSFDLPAMTMLYGERPLFIFDPADETNKPVPGYHDNALESWKIYPQFLRDLFTRAFTVGIKDPSHGRVREGEWRAAMIRLRDSILYCEHCSAENFYDAPDSSPCWSCRAALRLPFRIRINKSVVLLNHDSRLYPHHIDDQHLYDFSSVVAQIKRHPSRPEVWGLQNTSQTNWFFRTATNPLPTEIPPGSTLSLVDGTKINFGKCEGEVKS